MRYVKIQIACEHPLDLPFIREALLHRSTRIHVRDGHKEAIDSKNMTNAVAYNIDQESISN